MHIIEKQYLGLELKNPARIHVLQDTAAFAAGAYLEAVGDDDVSTNVNILPFMLLFLLNPHTPNYVFTQPAQQVIHNIKVGEALDLQILRVLPANKTLFFNFLWSKDRVTYCRWTNEELYIVDLQRQADKPGIQRAVSLVSLHARSPVFTSTLIEAIKGLIFLRLTEPEVIQLAAGQKQGTRKQGHYNATAHPVVIVDSSWNKYIIRTEGFGVSGHFRLQRYGEGNAELKLTWIKPYLKHGYARLPKTEATPKKTA